MPVRRIRSRVPSESSRGHSKVSPPSQAPDKPQPKAPSPPPSSAEELPRPGEGIIAFISRVIDPPITKSDVFTVATSDTTDSPPFESANICCAESRLSFCSIDAPNQWISYKFQGLSIQPSTYLLRSGSFPMNSAHPQSWLLEGSNDGMHWTELDSRQDNHDLNGPNLTAIFTIKKPGHFSQFRLQQTIPNHCGNNSLAISFFDIFGDITRHKSFSQTGQYWSHTLTSFSGHFKIRSRGNDLFLQFRNGRRNDDGLLSFGPVAKALVFTPESLETGNDPTQWTRIRAGPFGFWVVVDHKERKELKISTKNPTGDAALFRFIDGHICIKDEFSLTMTAESIPVFQKIRKRSPKQLFDLLLSRPLKVPPVRLGEALSGEFRIRHVSSKKYLAAGTASWGTLTLGFEFTDKGDLFKAETADSQWTRVIGKDGLVWFALKSGSPSEFGLHRWSDVTSSFCLFKYRNGHILDAQKERVLTVGSDGRPWLVDVKPEDDGSQKFEILMGDEVVTQEFNLEVDKAIPLEVIVDSFQLDSFE
jgi:hypothetical protein